MLGRSELFTEQTALAVLPSLLAGAGATFAQLGHFLLWATLGSAVGGSVFVALLKYGPARKPRRKRPPQEHAHL